MALHPVGPLPASTYWRRRAVVLVVVVVALLGLRACASGGGHHPRATPRPTPSPTRSQATPPPAAGSCPDSALALTVSTDAGTYSLGGTPRISLAVTNTGAAPCTRDLAGPAVELLVYSGNDRIWSSQDCAPAGTPAPTLLSPQAKRPVTTITWSGKRSAPHCAGTRSPAAVGTYYVRARVGTLVTRGAVFRFHA